MAAPKVPVIEYVDVDELVILERKRPLDEGAVTAIMDSIQEIGLKQPISIRPFDRIDPATGKEVGAYSLITGRHRLEAFKRLGIPEIPCIERKCSDIEAELEEIAENLHRADLTALERDQHLDRWIKLTDERRKEVSTQVVSKPQGGRPESGMRAAARELGINREDARKAVKTASLSDKAKQTARDLGLDNNRGAMLTAANETVSDKQVATLNAIATAREDKTKERQRDHLGFKIATAMADHIPRDQIPNLVSDLRQTTTSHIAKHLRQIG